MLHAVATLALHALVLAPHVTTTALSSCQRSPWPLLSGAGERLTEIEQLQADLASAIEDEDYAAAASLRDKVASLEVDDEMGVLSVNNEFYAAFATGDYERMDNVWADGKHDMVCLHPRMPPLYGRDDVMASWKFILASASMSIEAKSVRCMLVGSTAIVTCFEVVDGSSPLVATNVFVRSSTGKDKGWRMVHHMAGQVMQQRDILSPEAEA